MKRILFIIFISLLMLSSCSDTPAIVGETIVPSPIRTPVSVVTAPIPSETSVPGVTTPIPSDTPVLILATPIPTATPAPVIVTPIITATTVPVIVTPIITASPVPVIATPIITATAQPQIFAVPQIYIYYNKQLTTDYSAASIKIYNCDGSETALTSNDISIKIRGNSTAEAEKKPYTVKFEEKENLFNLGSSKGWCLLANAFDKSLMRNKLALDFADAISISYVSDSIFTDVYINDNFVGNYLLTTTVSEGKDKVDIDFDNNEYLIELDMRNNFRFPSRFPQWQQPTESEEIYKCNTSICDYSFTIKEPETPTTAQIKYVSDFLNSVENALSSADYDTISSLIDIDSFINYYILLEYFKDVDVSYSSTFFYIKGGKLFAGPAWDFDLSAGNVSTNIENKYKAYNNASRLGYGDGISWKGFFSARLPGVTTSDPYFTSYGEFKWFTMLFSNIRIYDMMKDRFLEIQPIIVNLYSDNSLGKNQIDTLIEQYGESFIDNFESAEWTFTQSRQNERIPDATFEENVEYLRNWLMNRNNWMLEMFYSVLN